jgi:tyrosyl-tRNA synthetase
MKNDKETQAKIQEILTRGVHDVFTKDELQKKLESGKPLIVKLGTDVTGSDLHLGHAVLHRKIRELSGVRTQRCPDYW